MNQKTSVKKNFLYQIIFELLVLILPFVTSPYISRVLGAEGLGTFSYTHSIAYYFVLFSMLGLKNYGNRAIAQAREQEETLNRTFSGIFYIHAVTSVLCIAVYVGYVLSLGQDRLYAAIQGAYVLSGLLDISWFYFGIERFKLTVSISTVVKILNVICVFVFVRSSGDLWKYCAIMAVGILLNQLALWFPLRRYTRLVRVSRKEMTVHLKPMLVLFIPAIAISLYKYMDKIMIGSMSSKTQLGFYENAEKVITIPMSVISSFGTVMLPKMSNLAASKDKREAQRYITLSMEFVMCLAFALAFGLSGVGKVFAPVFWGEDFSASGTIIMGLAITIPFIAFANVIRTQYLIPNSKDKEYLVSVIVGAAVNLVVNYLLIPRYGAYGATVGTVLAEVTVCLIQSYSVRKELPLLQYMKKTLPFFALGILMFAGVYFVGQLAGISVRTLLLQVFLGGVFYCLVCLFLFLREKNEVVLSMLKRVRKLVKK